MNKKPSKSSLYPPPHPPNCKILLKPESLTLSKTDHAIVALSSLFVVGAVAWVPAVYTWAWRRYRAVPESDKKKKALYGTFLMSLALVGIMGPHRKYKVGEWLKFKKWRIWKAWVNFIAMEVVSDLNSGSGVSGNISRSNQTMPQSTSSEHKGAMKEFDMVKDQAIFAIVPHGIFPFALGFSALPQVAVDIFGPFRLVVATATNLFPVLRTIISWLGGVDASKEAVDKALSNGWRIGLAPGGIAEMFEGYPKPGRLPDDECAILKTRKGFIKMAMKHKIPVVPVYCFGGSKLLKRLQLPPFIEKISNLLRISICLFFGQFGLPIPFRRRLLFAVGQPITPPMLDGSIHENSAEFKREVDIMHKRFCDELVALFDRHKPTYGWDHKTLRIV